MSLSIWSYRRMEVFPRIRKFSRRILFFLFVAEAKRTNVTNLVLDEKARGPGEAMVSVAGSDRHVVPDSSV